MSFLEENRRYISLRYFMAPTHLFVSRNVRRTTVMDKFIDGRFRGSIWDLLQAIRCDVDRWLRVASDMSLPEWLGISEEAFNEYEKTSTVNVWKLFEKERARLIGW